MVTILGWSLIILIWLTITGLTAAAIGAWKTRP